MICKADTVGVFQIESRAQMSMLPRLRPRVFYDLVVEVAIVRPGPIQGDMVHPYLRRRSGEEPIEYPDEAIRKVLGKTLGVPLFQEQAMALAIVAAGFTPGQADALRRAIAAWKRNGNRIAQFGDALESGMVARGYSRKFAMQVFTQIKGFAGYGFPESHAASFALLVYASSWLKRHHPAAFTASLLNSQPMGFYAPAQIIRDARDHGVAVRAIDVHCSRWDSTLERGDDLALALARLAGLGSTTCSTTCSTTSSTANRAVHPAQMRGTRSASSARQEIQHQGTLSDANRTHSDARVNAHDRGEISRTGWGGPESFGYRGGGCIEGRAVSDAPNHDTNHASDHVSDHALNHTQNNARDPSFCAEHLRGREHDKSRQERLRAYVRIDEHRIEHRALTERDEGMNTTRAARWRRYPESGSADEQSADATQRAAANHDVARSMQRLHSRGKSVSWREVDHSERARNADPKPEPMCAPSPMQETRAHLSPHAQAEHDARCREAHAAGASEIPDNRFMVPTQSAVRLGMRMVRGLEPEEAARVVDAVARHGTFRQMRDLFEASGVRAATLRKLAAADAFTSMGLDRQQASWQILALRDRERPLWSFGATTSPSNNDSTTVASVVDVEQTDTNSMSVSQEASHDTENATSHETSHETSHATSHDTTPDARSEIPHQIPRSTSHEFALDDALDDTEPNLPRVAELSAIAMDFEATSVTLKGHPLACIRPQLQRAKAPWRAIPCGHLRDASRTPAGEMLAVAGVVLVRQRPSTAKGILFMTIEDETGVANLVVRTEVYERLRPILRHASVLVAYGKVERRHGVTHVVVTQAKDIADALAPQRQENGQQRVQEEAGKPAQDDAVPRHEIEARQSSLDERVRELAQKNAHDVSHQLPHGLARGCEAAAAHSRDYR